MSATTSTDFDLRQQLVRIDRATVETRKFQAEAARFPRVRFLALVLASTVLGDAIAAIIPTLFRAWGGALTPTRLRECLVFLRWSQRGLADALKFDDRLVRRWASGDGAVPGDVAAWLENLATAVEARPPPGFWRRRAA